MKLFSMFISLLVCLTSFAQEGIKIGEVENRIQLGPYAGNRDLSFGVANILEELIQDKGFDLNPNSTTVLKVELLYFDVKKTNVQVAVYGKGIEVTEIIARAYLIIDGEKQKPVVAKGQTKSISTSTLIIDSGGKFSQSDASSALKKLCISLLEKLKL